MTRFATLSQFSVFSALTFVLAGCPVWGPDGHGGGMFRPDSGTTSDSGVNRPGCMSNAECPAGDECDRTFGMCIPAVRTCMTTAECPSGSYCDERRTCVPGCANNNDCAAQGAGLVCNPTTRRCEAGGGCTTNAQCMGTDTCVGGRCRAPAQVCQFNFQCSAGQDCVDGRCVGRCSMASPCPTGQTCNAGRCENTPSSGGGVDCGGRCAEGQVCSSGVCTTPCMNDVVCGAGRFCDQGACRVDDRRPVPFCPTNACSGNSVCIDGVCRISCARTRMLAECQAVDGTTSLCEQATAICRFPSEVSPQCRRSVDCTMGQQCIDARCQ